MSIWDEAPKNSRAVFEHLKILARRMRVESYGEIADAIGERENRKIAPMSAKLSIRIHSGQNLPTSWTTLAKRTCSKRQHLVAR